MPHLKITEVILVYFNICNNVYQQNARVLYRLAPKIAFGQLTEISPTNFMYLKTCNSDFSYTKVWFTDQNSKPLEIE